MAKDWEIPRLLDAYGPLLTEKQRAVTAHYYDEDLSLAEIAENEGVTRQAVRDVIRRTEEQLTQWEAALGIVARAGAVADLREAALRDDPALKERVLAFCEKEEAYGV